MSAQVPMSARNMPKTTLLSYKGSQGAILKIMGKDIFCYKIHSSKKRLFLDLDPVHYQMTKQKE